MDTHYLSPLSRCEACGGNQKRYLLHEGKCRACLEWGTTGELDEQMKADYQGLKELFASEGIEI